MKAISEILPLSRVVLDMEASSKKRLFEQVAQLLHEQVGLPQSDVFDCLVARERLGSTGLGHGVAMPHGRHADVQAALQNVIDLLKAQGAETIEVSLPQTALSIPAYYVLASAEASTNLSRYDGVRYGHRAAQFGDLEEMYSNTRAEGFGSEVKRRIMIGTYVLSHGYYDAYYLKAQKLRRLVANDFQTAFAQCDFILAPTAPTAAPKLGSDIHDPVQMYLSDIYTIAVNLAGLPALTLPAGFSSSGLPIGVQFIGNHFSEAKILGAAHQVQLVSDWHTQTPDGKA